MQETGQATEFKKPTYTVEFSVSGMGRAVTVTMKFENGLQATTKIQTATIQGKKALLIGPTHVPEELRGKQFHFGKKLWELAATQGTSQLNEAQECEWVAFELEDAGKLDKLAGRLKAYGMDSLIEPISTSLKTEIDPATARLPRDEQEERTSVLISKSSFLSAF